MNHALRTALFGLFPLFALVTGCAAQADDPQVSIASTAQAQTREHILLARQVGLTAVAESMGTRDGRIVVQDAAGASQIFAVDRAIYTAGAPVYASSSYELCEQGRAGLVSCDAIIAAPEASEYECDENACTCEGVGDCLKMALSGVCDDSQIICSEARCYCER